MLIPIESIEIQNFMIFLLTNERVSHAKVTILIPTPLSLISSDGSLS
jgi:hypothetical protein